MVAGPWKDGGHIHLKNVASNKNLTYNIRVKADGIGSGPFATWIVHRLNPGQNPQHVKLENKAHSGKYLRITQQGELDVGGGGKWCEFLVAKHAGNFVLISKQNRNHHVGFENNGSIKPPKNTGNGRHAQFMITIATFSPAHSSSAISTVNTNNRNNMNNNMNQNNNMNRNNNNPRTCGSLVVVAQDQRPYLYHSTTITNSTAFPFTLYSYNECDGFRIISHQKKDLLPSNSATISAKGYDGIQIDVYNGKDRLHRFFAPANSRYNLAGSSLNNISVAPVTVVVVQQPQPVVVSQGAPPPNPTYYYPGQPQQPPQPQPHFSSPCPPEQFDQHLQQQQQQLYNMQQQQIQQQHQLQQQQQQQQQQFLQQQQQIQQQQIQQQQQLYDQYSKNPSNNLI